MESDIEFHMLDKIQHPRVIQRIIRACEVMYGIPRGSLIGRQRTAQTIPQLNRARGLAVRTAWRWSGLAMRTLALEFNRSPSTMSTWSYYQDGHGGKRGDQLLKKLRAGEELPS